MIGRFFTVGFACALLHNAIVIAGDWAGLHYAASLSCSLVIVGVLGYRLHTSWTFPWATRSPMSFARYAAIVSASYPVSLAGMFLFVDRLRLPVPVATPTVTILLAGVSFFANRWLFSRGLRTDRRP